MIFIFTLVHFTFINGTVYIILIQTLVHITFMLVLPHVTFILQLEYRSSVTKAMSDVLRALYSIAHKRNIGIYALEATCVAVAIVTVGI